VHFVAGPEVDWINQQPLSSAAESLCKSLLNQTSKSYQTVIYKKLAQEHAWNLVRAVHNVVPYPALKDKLPWMTKEQAKNAAKTKLPEQRSLFDYVVKG
jgi:hypothetical protein